MMAKRIPPQLPAPADDSESDGDERADAMETAMDPDNPDIVPPAGAENFADPAAAVRPKGLSIRDYLLEARRIIEEMVPAQSRFNVSDLPDGRTLRYYQTLNLVDRPVRYQGRSVYLQRHLLQLVAVKLLQADQYTLSKIQQLLSESDDKGLREIIRRRAGTLDSLLVNPGNEAGTGATPATVSADEDAATVAAAATLLRRFTLGDGVEVTLEDGRRYSRQRCMELARKLHELLLRNSGWPALERPQPRKTREELEREDSMRENRA
ncbi:MAG TPA: MerR family transcriptional regulator [Planctomycetota bacterium]|nr:MerR family transcriptional regulator [Planctomycetota bacterium]